MSKKLEKEIIGLLMKDDYTTALARMAEHYSNVRTRTVQISHLKYLYLERIRPNQAFVKKMRALLRQSANGNDKNFLVQLLHHVDAKKNRAIETMIQKARTGKSDDAYISEDLRQELIKINPWTNTFKMFKAAAEDTQESKRRNEAAQDVYAVTRIIDLSGDRARYMYKVLVSDVCKQKDFVEDDYSRILFCLLLASGRRHVEVAHPKATFTEVLGNPFYAKMMQAKNRGIPDPFNCPLLIPFEKFQQLHVLWQSWANVKFTMSPNITNKDVSGKTNQYFNDRFKKLCNSTGITNIIGKESLTMHTLRKCYLSFVMASFDFYPQMSDVRIAESLVLGHKSGGKILGTYLQKRASPLMLYGIEKQKRKKLKEKEWLLFGIPKRVVYDESKLRPPPERADQQQDDVEPEGVEDEPVAAASSDVAPDVANQPEVANAQQLNVATLKVAKMEVDSFFVKNFNVEQKV